MNIFAKFAFGSTAPAPAAVPVPGVVHVTNVARSSPASISRRSSRRAPAAQVQRALASRSDRLAELALIRGFRSELPRQTVDEFHQFLLNLRGELGRYWALVACLLSVQCRDVVALRAVRALIARCPNGAPDILALRVDAGDGGRLVELEALVGSCNFYKTKAANIVNVTRALVKATRARELLRVRPRRKAADEAPGATARVPSDYSSLVALPGVGPKIAHLMRSVAFGVDETGIVVDTHVSRIATRLGWVACTAQGKARGGAEGARRALEAWVPRGEWMAFTLAVVGFGQFVAQGEGAVRSAAKASSSSNRRRSRDAGEDARAAKRPKLTSSFFAARSAPMEAAPEAAPEVEPQWAAALRAYARAQIRPFAKAEPGHTGEEGAAAAGGTAEGKSKYEIARAERLARNRAFLQVSS